MKWILVLLVGGWVNTQTIVDENPVPYTDSGVAIEISTGVSCREIGNKFVRAAHDDFWMYRDTGWEDLYTEYVCIPKHIYEEKF